MSGCGQAETQVIMLADLVSKVTKAVLAHSLSDVRKSVAHPCELVPVSDKIAVQSARKHGPDLGREVLQCCQKVVHGGQQAFSNACASPDDSSGEDLWPG